MAGNGVANLASFSVFDSLAVLGKVVGVETIQQQGKYEKPDYSFWLTNFVCDLP